MENAEKGEEGPKSIDEIDDDDGEKPKASGNEDQTT